jgi:putative hydrolase of the HAD superfamily
VTAHRLNWNDIDTVLLDMDGTLLDLEYDNVLWNERLPRAFAARNGLTTDGARTRLARHFDETRHTIEHYCLDYWSNYTQVDVIALHRELAHLIRFRPHAETFLARLRAIGKRALLVTNAHRAGLAIKDEVTSLTQRLDHAVSSHDYRVPKESSEFWSKLERAFDIDPRRALLLDDNMHVLHAAERHGISTLLTVSQPDSSRPPRDALEHAAFNSFDEIMP